MTTTEIETRMPWWVSREFDKARGGAKPVTAKRATTLARANWEVGKYPLYAEVVDDEGATSSYVGPVGDHFGLLRQDTKDLLGVVGARYQPIQNVATARWAEEIADKVKGTLAGSWVLKGGKVFGVTIEPRFASVKVGSESFEPYLHVLNWHGDGALEAHVTFSSENQVMLTGRSGPLHVRTTGSAEQVATWAGVVVTDFDSDAAALLAQKANQKTLLGVYGKLWPKPGDSAGTKSVSRWKNRQVEILTVWNAVVDDDVRDTAWGVYLAFNTWAQFHRPFRGSGGDPGLQELLRGEEVLMGHAREIGEGAIEQLVKPNKR